MIFENFIGIEDNFLNDDECDMLIDYMFSGDFFCEEFNSDKYRKDSCVYVKNMEDFKWLTDRLYSSLKIYTNKYNLPFKYNTHEIKIQESSDDGGFTSWHYEWSPTPDGIKREIVWMIYLNDNFEFGRTEFNFDEIYRVVPKAGKLVLFPASFTHTHRAEPKLIGTKYTTTNWFYSSI